jgi:hypothetical protein
VDDAGPGAGRSTSAAISPKCRLIVIRGRLVNGEPLYGVVRKRAVEVVGPVVIDGLAARRGAPIEKWTAPADQPE